jgi:PAS domain S-box-containing protein
MQNLKLLRERDWAGTELGAMSTWPVELRAVVETIMRSTFPICLALGPRFTQIYNDSYNVIYGNKHPASFGAPAVESWEEIWPFLEPALTQVVTAREPRQFSNYLLPLRRFKPGLQECYFDFCYSPVVASDGRVLGILSIATETTPHAIAARRQPLVNLTVDAAPEMPSPISRKLQELLGENELDGKAAFVSHYRDHEAHLEWSKVLEREEALGLLDYVVRRRGGDRCGVVRFDGQFRRDGYADYVAFADFASVDGKGTKTLVLWPSELVTEESSLDLVLRLEQRLRSLSMQLVTISLLKEELGQTDFFYRFLFENSIEGVIYSSTSEDGTGAETIIAANKPACDLLGYSQQEIVGKRREEFFFDSDEALDSALAERATQSTYKGELTFKHKSGRPVEAEITSILVRLNSGERRSISVLRSVSEKLRVERDRAERSRLESIARMTGGVSHDFNNLLMVILSAAEHLEATLANPEEKEVVGDIITASTRAASLTSQLVAYSRRQNLQPVRVEINEAIRETQRLMRGVVPKAVHLHYSFSRRELFSEVDLAGLTSALANLLRNASDAMEGQGHVAIKISLIKFAKPQSAWLQAGEYVAISVKDEGVGVPPAMILKIFEPYFTTKQSRGGSGLGLSMVQGFARQSGGEVVIASAAPKGTTATLYLPRLAAGNRPNEDQQPGEGPLLVEGDGHILLVDDDLAVRRQIGRIATSIKMPFVEASTAEEAIAMLDTSPRLVIADLIMPGEKSGIHVIEAAKNCQPPIPAILITGFAGDSDWESGKNKADRILTKPFSRKDLIRAIRSILAGH